MSRPLFYVAPGALDGAAPGGTMTVDGAEGRHAVAVRRLGVGEGVDVSDGAGTRAVGTVSRAEGSVLEAVVDTVVHEERPPFRLVLVQALAKGDRDELAAETATELGVDAVVPWQAERSIVRWKGERAQKALAKWRSVVLAAAKQARRAWVPDVEPAVDGGRLAERIAQARLAVVLHEEASESLTGILRGVASGDGEGEILFIVGPEGGISPAELERFVQAGARLALLGPHVLRSSTAGPAALALAGEHLGRWGSRDGR
ncbi:Ribosomal RNA small subunit methyltransferase E [Sinomonas atrocyanea]|uniref:Ribosomal RNA small subunit methyltransferase E n=1 Tax=Sinomonas atrocyanea TaxID=37927 RepID=A0A126ZZZ5_9MICC|nr:16S rRNA (uracil(1498)-N(3))-methyltransferase [Sinomonas atrocyanea]AMM32768.1 Ribosomal RNA small subunit methyltransferase E [Sinomonas atrocyanea]GEB62806.1 ribosomal RNA small subunit methyltransferase E [Sinomonas atrocyanea]GGG72445.1 ribosomal RNA small subunit methyltransferase E [Sinomonas atrocyanea]